MPNDIIVRLLADDSQAQSTVQAFEDRILDLAGPLASGAIAIESIKIGLQEVFEGEALNAISAQFELLANNAGIAADSLKKGLIDAAAGMTSENDLLQAANEGLIRLGSSAKQLPELFELARKATVIFGGTAVDNFKALEAGIANANVRALAHLGIQIDLKLALQKFAEEQGLAVNELTKAGRAQAVLEAALKQGATAYDGVSESIKPATSAWNELKASISDLGDTLKKEWANSVGPTFTLMLEGASFVAKEVNKVIRNGLAIRDEIEAKITGRTKDVEGLDQTMQHYYQTMSLAAAKGEQLTKKTFGDPELIAADQNKIRTELTKSHGEFLALQEKNFAAEDAASMSFSNHAADEIKNRNDRIINLQQQFNEQKTALDLQFQKSGMGHNKQYQEELTNLELVYGEKRKQIQQESTAFAAKMAETAKTGIVNGLTSAFSNLGKAMATTGNAFSAFEAAALSAIGGIAIQMGSMLVMAGLGWSVIPGFQASAAAVAEGLGLIVLGGALEGIGGSISSSAGSSAGAGAGSSPIGQNTATNSPTGPSVNVQVLGNVFDNRQTGLAIVDAINEAWQNQGAAIAQVSQTA